MLIGLESLLIGVSVCLITLSAKEAINISIASIYHPQTPMKSQPNHSDEYRQDLKKFPRCKSAASLSGS
jgi:hypothetical protein